MRTRPRDTRTPSRQAREPRHRDREHSLGFCRRAVHELRYAAAGAVSWYSPFTRFPAGGFIRWPVDTGGTTYGSEKAPRGGGLRRCRASLLRPGKSHEGRRIEKKGELL